MHAYAGIGARATPQNVLKAMEYLGEQMANEGWMLRSGGADGADTAFENGCDKASGHKQIFLPWKGFNGNQSPLIEPAPDAYILARKFHPAWNRLTGPVQRLMARNAHQLLGRDLQSPSRLIICWTKDGKISGGTGQALRMGQSYGIPIVNLGDPNQNHSDEINKILAANP